MIKAILAHLADKARPGARTAAATRAGAVYAGLKGFTQRHRINRRYPDAVGSMPGQGVGWADGCPRWQCDGDEGAIGGDRGEVAPLSATRPVAPAHFLPGTGLLKG